MGIGIGIGIGGLMWHSRGGVSAPDGDTSLLILTTVSDVRIDLSWTSSSTNHDGYRIYISTDNITFTEKGTSAGTTYSATGLSEYTRYYFRVVAYKGSQESIGATADAYTGGYYGIQIDESNSSPDLTRISSPGAMTLHASLPVHSLLKGCLLADDGTVNYYLKSDDWSKKANGDAATLSGADGQVMVEWPDFYYKVEQNTPSSGKHQIKISQYALTGFTLVPKHYVSAYEATVARSSNKLSSVKSTNAEYRGGNNNAAWDAGDNTLLGKPASNISRTNFRTYARNRGTGFNCYSYKDHKWLFWFFAIEYATLNSQKAVNATLTAEGYKQGGLGNGVSGANSTEWNTFSSYYPFINCGASDSLANSSGEVSVTVTNFGGVGTDRTFKVPRYRGHENPFGHIWKICDGINIKIYADKVSGIFNTPPGSPSNGQRVIVGASPTDAFTGKAHNIAVYSTGTSTWTFTAWSSAWATWQVYSDAEAKYYINADGAGWVETTNTNAQTSEVYVADDPTKWSDSLYTDYELRGVLHRASGYMNKALMGSKAEMVPSQAGIGGSGSTAYYCDYFYTSFPTTGETLRMLLVGSVANDGARDGFACSDTTNGPSNAYASFGSRLSYLTP